MRIAFLMGGLEPEANGVGDYSRLLAREIARQDADNHCFLVALNDSQVTAPQRAPVAERVEELRLPSTLPWIERIAQAKAFLDEGQVEFVSLQFVPYAWHPKGIVFGLKRRLQPLMQGRRVHVMCHELWIGEGNAPLKDRIVGTLQRFCLRQFLHGLRPDVVHSSNALYVEMLRRIGVEARILPLFGNIPIVEPADDEWLFALLREQGIKITNSNRDTFWLFGFFGALHPVWPPEPLFGYIREAAAQRARCVVILSAGRMGDNNRLWQEMVARYSTDFEFGLLGEQPAPNVSEYLQAIDFGIAASPWSLIGKSSAAASMLEHGLPIVVNRDDVAAPANANEDEPAFIKMDATLPRRLAEVSRGACESRLPVVAQRLMDDLGWNRSGGQNRDQAP